VNKFYENKIEKYKTIRTNEKYIRDNLKGSEVITSLSDLARMELLYPAVFDGYSVKSVENVVNEEGFFEKKFILLYDNEIYSIKK
jgi:hypothetical protein